MSTKKGSRSILPHVRSLLHMVAANHPMVVAVLPTRDHRSGRGARAPQG